MNYQDLHKAPSQSSEQGAPDRIWLDMNEGYPVIGAEGMGLPEYTRSDICAALVEALEGLYALIEKGDLVRDVGNDDKWGHFAAQGLRITKALDAACFALAQVKEGANKSRILECADCGQKLNPDDNHSCRQQRKRNKR